MDKARFSLIKILNQEFNVTLVILNKGQINKNHIDIVDSICSRLILINVKDSVIENIPFFHKIRTLLLIIKSIVFYQPTFISSIYSRKFYTDIRKLVYKEKFDIIQPLSDYTLKYALGLKKTKSFLFFGPNDDMVGMSESILARKKNKHGRFFLKIELRSRKNMQKKLIQYSNRSCFFSQMDIQKIISRDPEFESKLVWMPGVIEYEDEWTEDSINYIEKNSIVFTGGLVSEFNRQSLVYFFENIWPILIKEIRNIKFYIVGQTHGNDFQKQYAYPNVYYTGRVDSVRPWLEKAAVFVNPSISGTGIKTKMVEALRFGKPIVTTIEGTSGLWHIPEDTIFD